MAANAPAVSGSAPARTTFSVLLFGVLPLMLVCGFTLAIAIAHERFAFDFHTFWDAARTVAGGHSPYPAPETVANTHAVAGDYEYFVYPPPFALAMLPFGVLPFAVAASIYTVALLVCVAATLALLEVRDWRCYGLAFGTIPALSSFRLGTVTPVLMLLVAVAWRCRDQWLKVGTAVGCAILLKLFLWPLVVCLLLTRRWLASAAAVGGAAAASTVAWAVLGFEGLGDYPALLRSLSRVEAVKSYSLVAVADRLQLPHPQVTWLALAVPIVLALVGGCLRTRHSLDFERTLYGTMVGVALLLTPILWLNYFALLIVPVALRRKTLGPEWALLLAFWLSPLPLPTTHPLWRLCAVLVLVLLIVAPARFQVRAEGFTRRARSAT